MSLVSPKCPECGARGVHCDPAGVVWLCTGCDPNGRPFTISVAEAEPHRREHEAALRELEGFARRRYTPIPRVRGK